RFYEKSTDYFALLKNQNLPSNQAEVLKNLFAFDVKEFIQNVENKKPKKKVFIKPKHLQEFQNLWNTINKNAFYVLDILDEESENQLVQNIKKDIERLNIEEILLRTIRAELNINKIEDDDAVT